MANIRKNEITTKKMMIIFPDKYR